MENGGRNEGLSVCCKVDDGRLGLMAVGSSASLSWCPKIQGVRMRECRKAGCRHKGSGMVSDIADRKEGDRKTKRR